VTAAVRLIAVQKIERRFRQGIAIFTIIVHVAFISLNAD